MRVNGEPYSPPYVPRQVESCHILALRSVISIRRTDAAPLCDGGRTRLGPPRDSTSSAGPTCVGPWQAFDARCIQSSGGPRNDTRRDARCHRSPKALRSPALPKDVFAYAIDLPRFPRGKQASRRYAQRLMSRPLWAVITRRVRHRQLARATTETDRSDCV